MTNTFKTLVLAGAAMSFALPTIAMASAEVSHKAMMEVSAARADLKNGRTDAAIERMERAETTLLNAKQAGDETAPQALDAIESAHKDVMDRNTTGAITDLDSALSALRS